MQLNFLNSILLATVGILCFVNCNEVYKNPPALMLSKQSVLQAFTLNNSLKDHQNNLPFTNTINTGTTTANELLIFARTLQGIPYKYASADPDSGFDCSGFITYVFNHFNIGVPRASASFTNIEKEVSLANARPGDLILFTGTDSVSQTVGHMGIIETVINGKISFIHASSGKANGVTISPLEGYYMSRFVKAIRVF